jgi:hypothetical protein
MKVTRWVMAALGGASLAVLVSGTSLAEGAAQPAPAKAAPAKKAPAKTAPADAGNEPQIEPGVLAALGRMSAFLRTNTSFEATSHLQRDDVDDYGQIVTFDGQTVYKVKAPGAFTVEVTEGPKTRKYVYDGKSLTIFDPKTNYYAHFDAPSTIRATLDLAEQKYGVVVPLDDLFHWDQGEDYAKKLTSAHWVGKTQVDGQDVDQYVLSQPGVNWQIWITSGDKPLPVRVMIIASQDPARPRFEANLTWNLAPQFSADTFVFTPPAGAKAIPIVANAQ